MATEVTKNCFNFGVIFAGLKNTATNSKMAALDHLPHR